LKFRFGFENLLLEGEPASALSGGAPEPGPEIIPDGGAAAIESIYGELQVKFPEGMDETLREEPSLKGFVDRESGEINYSNLMKSYVHGQKQVGMNKAVLPTENSSPEELDAFYEKLGYKPNEVDYTLNRAEESKLSEDRVTALKTFARENRMPLAQAQKLVEMMEGNANSDLDNAASVTAESIKSDLEGLKTEWGQAYEPNVAIATRVLNEVVNDEAIKAVFADPRIGSNPAVIKALAAIGQKLFKEDGFQGKPSDGALSPADADIEINEIMGDRKGAYWNKSHPSHADVVAKVGKLFKMKEGR